MNKLIKMLSNIERCEMDFASQLQTQDKSCVSNGRLNNVDFDIKFHKGKNLRLTVYCKGAWTFATVLLRGRCSEYMGNAEPICQYYEDNPTRTTIEWDLVNPEERLSEIINSKGEFAEKQIRNIVLFNGRKLFKYEDKTLAEAAV